MTSDAQNRVADASSPEVKERIESAACRLFAEKGYSGTALREIALAAGVTKPMIYYYFGSKEELYRSLLEAARAGFEERLAELLASGSSVRETLIALVHLHATGARDNPAITRLIMVHAFGPRKGVPAFDLGRFYDTQRSALLKLLTPWVDAGELDSRQAELFATVFWGAIGTFSAAIDRGQLLETEILAEQTVDLLLDGVRNRGKNK